MGNRSGGGYPQNSGVLVVLVCSILIPFFFNFVVACRLCVIYVNEDNDSNVQAMITWFIWTT